MKTRRPAISKRQNKFGRFGVLGLGCLLLVGSVLYYFLRDGSKTPSPQISTQTTEQKTETSTEPAVELPPLIDLQPTVDAWVATQRADYGIEVFDVANQKVVGAHQANEGYYTASIYKLYVVYLTYQKMQSGEVVDMPNFLGNQSRLDCLHEAIYTSDSPCAEKLMAELTQKVMQDKVNEYGATNTGFPLFETSAHDVNLVLNRLALKKDLNEAYTAKMLSSMSTQVYNKGLAKGFTGASVASKVGFNLDLNYHDTGIVTMPNGRQYLVSIMSEGQGSPAPHASLSAALNAAILAGS